MPLKLNVTGRVYSALGHVVGTRFGAHMNKPDSPQERTEGPQRNDSRENDLGHVSIAQVNVHGHTER